MVPFSPLLAAHKQGWHIGIMTHLWQACRTWLLIVLFLGTLREVLSQHIVYSGLAVRIMVLPLVHTVYEQPLQVPIRLIAF